MPPTADALAPLLSDGILEAVISRLKTGKEAEIFLVQQQGEIYAAKVYKERNARNFRNNAAYKEGRVSRNSRTQRAMEKGSRFGQRAAEDAWKAKELEALQKLHAAGVRVPEPVLLYEGVLVMEIVIDSSGHPAPRLIDAAIPVERAAEWYADLRQQAIRMLCCDLIHGDLSPYNVLLAWNGPTVIDFPQVIGAAHNSQAERFFRRDLETIHRFFAGIDPRLRAHAQDAREIWAAYQRRELTPDFVPTGRFEAPRHVTTTGRAGGGGPRHDRMRPNPGEQGGHPAQWPRSARPGQGNPPPRGQRQGSEVQGVPEHGADPRHPRPNTSQHHEGRSRSGAEHASGARSSQPLAGDGAGMQHAPRRRGGRTGSSAKHAPHAPSTQQHGGGNDSGGQQAPRANASQHRGGGTDAGAQHAPRAHAPQHHGGGTDTGAQRATSSHAPQQHGAENDSGAQHGPRAHGTQHHGGGSRSGAQHAPREHATRNPATGAQGRAQPRGAHEHPRAHSGSEHSGYRGSASPSSSRPEHRGASVSGGGRPAHPPRGRDRAPGRGQRNRPNGPEVSYVSRPVPSDKG